MVIDSLRVARDDLLAKISLFRKKAESGDVLDKAQLRNRPISTHFAVSIAPWVVKYVESLRVNYNQLFETLRGRADDPNLITLFAVWEWNASWQVLGIKPPMPTNEGWPPWLFHLETARTEDRLDELEQAINKIDAMLESEAQTEEPTEGVPATKDAGAPPAPNAATSSDNLQGKEGEENAESDSFSFDGFVVNMTERTVCVGKNVASFGDREKPFLVLSAILRAKGATLTRANILDSVWGPNEEIFDRAVDSNIGLAKKILAANGVDITLKGVKNIGYKYVMRQEHAENI